MKKNYLFLLTMAAVLSLGACKKTTDDDCNKVAAKIIKYECDRVIFQLLTPDIIGDADWENTQTGEHYSNVVSYYNTCAIMELTQGNMDTIYVKVAPENTDPAVLNCNQCLALPLDPPNTKVDFKDISLEPCNMTGVN